MALVKEFETLEGTIFRLRPLSPLIINHIEIQWEAKKPKVPVVEVHINGHTAKETNPHDPEYLEQVAAWQRAKANANYTTIFGLGIVDDVPKDLAKLYMSMLPDATPGDLRAFWATSVVGINTDECNALIERIVGQTMPTEKGLELSSERFQGDDKRDGRAEIQAAS